MAHTLRLAAAALAFTSLAAIAQTAPAPTANTANTDNQPVVPQVERRDVRVPRLPSRDFSVGAFVGTYSTQGFDSTMVGGLRVGYHVSEDFFVEGTFGSTKVSDKTFENIFGGNVLREPRLTYYSASLGWNALPGEVFFGRNVAKASSIYLVGGIGSTRFDTQRRQTLHLGVGMRLFLRDWAALQVDMRDHMFESDLLGNLRRTHNPEFTGGINFFF